MTALSFLKTTNIPKLHSKYHFFRHDCTFYSFPQNYGILMAEKSLHGHILKYLFSATPALFIARISPLGHSSQLMIIRLAWRSWRGNQQNAINRSHQINLYLGVNDLCSMIQLKLCWNLCQILWHYNRERERHSQDDAKIWPAYVAIVTTIAHMFFRNTKYHKFLKS